MSGSGNRDTNTERASVIERAAEVLKEGGGQAAHIEAPPKQVGKDASAVITKEPEVKRARPVVSSATVEKVAEPSDIETAPEKSEAVKEPEAPRKSGGVVTIDDKRARREGILIPGTDQSRTVAEFREIKRSVLFSMASSMESTTKNPNLVMVTSARPDEGKTFISINLAISLSSEKDYDVLLVDMDQTKRGVCNALGIGPTKGLIDVIENESMTLDDVILETNIEGLSVLPSGAFHPLGAELLNSVRMKLLLDDLSRRSREMIVIFDCPPVLATTEASILAQHVGHVLFVVEAGKTSKGNINDALELIGHSQNLGFILNKTRSVVGDTSFGAYSDYGYGYGKPS